MASRTKSPFEFLFACCEFTKVIWLSKNLCVMFLLKYFGIQSLFVVKILVLNNHYTSILVKKIKIEWKKKLLLNLSFWAAKLKEEDRIVTI